MAKKAKFIDIDDREHVARRAFRQKIVFDDQGRPRALAHVFKLRPKIKEGYLSSNYLERIPGTIEERLCDIRNLMRANNLECNRMHAFVVCNTGRVRSIGSAHSHNLRVLLTPKQANPGYSRITGLPLNNEDFRLLERLAAEAVVEVRSNDDLDRHEARVSLPQSASTANTPSPSDAVDTPLSRPNTTPSITVVAIASENSKAGS
jgi:hypothetical protein